MSDHRVLSQGLAVDPCFLDKLDHPIQQAGSERREGDTGALEVKERRRHVPAAVLLPYDISLGHLHIIEIRLVELMAVGDIYQGTGAEARGLHRSVKEADTLVLR